MIRELLALAMLAAVSASPAFAQKQQAVAPQVPAEPPSIVATINVPKQEMVVTLHGIEMYRWPVSTAGHGAITPAGTFKVQSMHVITYSRLFNNAPMPFSIFYDGHYAIHGTTSISLLGRPASKGCTRLHPDNAKILFEMVKARGPQSLQVVVVREEKPAPQAALR